MSRSTDASYEALDAGTAESVARRLRPVAPPPALREHVLARVRQEAESSPRRLHTVRAGREGWVRVADTHEEKLLHVDRATGMQSLLVRFLPGAVVPAHPHPRVEECLVIEGTLRIGEIDLAAGDYHVAPAGVPHPAITSERGCVVYIRQALAEAE